MDSHLQMSVPGPMTAQPEDYVLVFIFSHSTDNFFDSHHWISRFLLKNLGEGFRILFKQQVFVLFFSRYFAILSNIVMNTFVIKVQGMNICKFFHHFDRLFTDGPFQLALLPGGDENGTSSVLLPGWVIAEVSSTLRNCRLVLFSN